MSATDQVALMLVILAFPIFGLILAYESWPGRRSNLKNGPTARGK